MITNLLPYNVLVNYKILNTLSQAAHMMPEKSTHVSPLEMFSAVVLSWIYPERTV
jgi:hypothetical protein